MPLSSVVSRAKALTRALRPVDAPWAFTGSAGLVLQGGDVPVQDLDVQTTAAGAYEVERALQRHPVDQPVRYLESERIRSHYGTLRWEGVPVDVIGDPEKRGPDGEWREAPHLDSIVRFVEVGDLRVPVLDLEYEANAYRLIGRGERAAQIERLAGVQ